MTINDIISYNTWWETGSVNDIQIIKGHYSMNF